MYRSKIAAPRVVQKQSIPRLSWSIVRRRYAPQIAIANVAISAGRGSSVGSKSSESATAIGSQRTIVTTFQPANHAMSKWSGSTGRRRSRLRSPSRIRYSQYGAPKTTFMFRTSVQTM